MSKDEIALQITLALIENGKCYTGTPGSKAIAETATEIFNTILNGINVKD